MLLDTTYAYPTSIIVIPLFVLFSGQDAWSTPSGGTANGTARGEWGGVAVVDVTGAEAPFRYVIKITLL